MARAAGGDAGDSAVPTCEDHSRQHGPRHERRAQYVIPARLLQASGIPITGSRRLAERVGFEPTNTFGMLLEFQSSAFDHSATSPARRGGKPTRKAGERQR